MTDTTARLALPLLDSGQAQKEVTHNEALARIDIALQASVIGTGLVVPPAGPAEGQAWIVGDALTGDWAGHTHAVAGWTAGGWRFIAPADGMAVWSIADALVARFVGGAWVMGSVPARQVVIGGVPVLGSRRPPIADPSGGAAVDAEARDAIGAILDAMRRHGLIGD